jgi:protocatechuate 3,4-dioxygenase beta subunit
MTVSVALSLQTVSRRALRARATHAQRMSKTHEHAHDHGLNYDLSTLRSRSFSRRSLLRFGAGASLLTLVGCPNDSVATIGGDAGTDADGGTCSTIPEETAGPYPGDGSNGVNALVLSGIVRSDIRSSFADASGSAEGVPLSVTLTLVDPSDNCSPLAGCAVYLWHCDRDGNYSLYSSAIQDQNYLRGVQEADENGQVTFQTVFPGCYDGRWPHIHFEVFESLAAATSGSNKLATSQLALPQAACAAVYATSGYESSVQNLSRTSLDSDNVFRDGSTLQLASMSGSVGAGYTAALTVGVSLA